MSTLFQIKWNRFAPIRRILGLVAIASNAFCAPVVLAYTSLGNNTFQSNGSASDTQAAIRAAAPGGTVIIPAGTFTWPTPVTISKAITLQGASSSNRPVIISSYTGGSGISLNCTANQTITVKDIRFSNWMASNSLFLLGGSGVNGFRLTNLEFDGGHRWSIWVSSPGGSGGEGPYGLIDHCRWPNGGDVIYGRDNPVYNPNSWHRAMSWGSNKAVYVEDCTMNATGNPVSNAALDGDNGFRVVFRHNTVTNWLTSIHGADSAGPINSGLQAELMHNTFNVTQPLAAVLTLRGGSAVFFDNTITGTGYNAVVELAYYRSLPGGGGVCAQDRFYPQDYLGTQQPGMGVAPGAPDRDPHYPNHPWASVPVYYWGNHVQAPIWFSEVLANQGSPFVQLGRDYFVGTAKPDYTEFAYPHPLQTGSPPAPSATPSSEQQHPKKKKKKKKKAKKRKRKRVNQGFENEMIEGQDEGQDEGGDSNR
jgi:hypothetical protein